MYTWLLSVVNFFQKHMACWSKDCFTFSASLCWGERPHLSRAQYNYTRHFHATFVQLTLDGCFECRCSCYAWVVWHSYKFNIPRSRANVDSMTRGRPTAETPEASSYSWCLQSRLQLRMTSRRAVEWIEHSKVQLVFRHEISLVIDTFLCPHWVRTGGWGGQNSFGC